MSDLSYAKTLLENNELVAIPTETVYGLAANAFSEEAVVKIFQVKNRPAFDPLIVHTHSLAEIEKLVTHFPEKARRLAEVFLPGPLTLLLQKKDIIPDLVTSGLPSVAIRIPNHPLTLALLQSLDFPLAAPSANPFGYISPTTAQHVQDQLGDKIPYILDGGACSIGIESTIAGFENKQVTLYRLGGMSIESIESVIGKVQFATHSSSRPATPGMLTSHYAPRKPVFLQNLTDLIQTFGAENVGVLAFRKKIPDLPEGNQLCLSPAGDFTEAARNLFAYLRRLDAMPVKVVFAELLPEENLGRAINDRLRRAAAK
jgi:L-threonylcarbamoyladenylate synthase